LTDLILDTSVLSRFAPGKHPPIDGEILADLRATEDDWRVPTIVVAEIAAGIAKLRRAGGEARAALLDAWLTETIVVFADRILPLTTEIAVETGRLHDDLRARGRHPGLSDVVIAASAAASGGVVLTRNIRHFRPAGVRCLDPFEPGFLAALRG